MACSRRHLLKLLFLLFFLDKIQCPLPPFQQKPMHFHCAKSKPPNNSNKSIIFKLRLKTKYFCPTLRFYFNTVYPAQGCKIFSLFPKLLGTRTSLASLGALGFQLLQKLDPGGIGSVCLNGCLCACDFLHQTRTSLNIQIFSIPEQSHSCLGQALQPAGVSWQPSKVICLFRWSRQVLHAQNEYGHAGTEWN